MNPDDLGPEPRFNDKLRRWAGQAPSSPESDTAEGLMLFPGLGRSEEKEG